jgi:hypothetical protein
MTLTKKPISRQSIDPCLFIKSNCLQLIFEMFPINFNSDEDINRVGARTGKVVLKRTSQVPVNPVTGRPRLSQYQMQSPFSELFQSLQFSVTQPGIFQTQATLH